MSEPLDQVQDYGKLPNRRRPNLELRPREHLTRDEVHKLLAAADVGRNGKRNRLMVMVAFRHGLRAQELVGLKWDQIDFKTAKLRVERVKLGNTSVQPISGAELRLLRQHRREQDDTSSSSRLLRQHRREQDDTSSSSFVFLSERKTPMTTGQFHDIVQKIGKAAKFEFVVHPHMLRHACGYVLVNEGIDTRLIQDYLGHRSIQSVVRYTTLAPGRFKNFDLLF